MGKKSAEIKLSTEGAGWLAEFVLFRLRSALNKWLNIKYGPVSLDIET
jgi:hypothetical protein